MSDNPEVGDLIRVHTESGLILEGIVMPSTEFSSSDILVIKLSNGYNIGVSRKGAKVEILRKKAVDVGKVAPPGTSRISGKGPLKTSLISTGGTIVSKVEYETGAVKPAITAEELVEMVPEFLENSSLIEVLELYRVFSEDITPEHWSKLVREVAKRINEGFDAVIVAHGTDAMAFTASALAFALQNLPIPIMFVGAQRSSDRPSTDAVLNLKACMSIAKHAPYGEVVVVMHGTTSDEYILVHRGVKVRKMHTSRRDAFQSINDVPLSKVIMPEGKFIQLSNTYLPRKKGELLVRPKFSDKVALLKFYPNMDCTLIDYLVDRGYKGIIIEGTGLGHIRGPCIDSVKRASEEGVIVGITSQTLFGRVNLKVYTNGRRLLQAGAVPLSDMLPETAYVKLSWIIGNFPDTEREERVEMLTRNMVFEINPVHDVRHYPRWYHGD